MVLENIIEQFITIYNLFLKHFYAFQFHPFLFYSYQIIIFPNLLSLSYSVTIWCCWNSCCFKYLSRCSFATNSCCCWSICCCCRAAISLNIMYITYEQLFFYIYNSQNSPFLPLQLILLYHIIPFVSHYLPNICSESWANIQVLPNSYVDNFSRDKKKIYIMSLML